MANVIRVILGFLVLSFIASTSAQETVSPLFGFHTELVEANTATPISVNVTRTQDGIHSQTIGQTFGQYNAVSYTHLTLPTICSV